MKNNSKQTKQTNTAYKHVKPNNAKQPPKVNKDSVRAEKKNAYIIPVVAACVAVLIVLVAVIASGNNGSKGFAIADRDGNMMIGVITAVDENIEYAVPEYEAYVKTALAEAVDIVCSKKKCSKQEAMQWLVDKNCTINTAFDSDFLSPIVSAYNTSPAAGSDFGAAVTDLNGALLCAYSAGEENYAVMPTAPYSSLKPLSVYAPAIENDIIHYSTTFIDAPVKKITTDDGSVIDWPQNGVGYFTGRETTVADAIKLSLNTIAVRCLKSLDVSTSVKFLNKELGINLDFELQKIAQGGDEEVLSNLGLGYLYEGVSPIDMAGFYQMFANGGKYIKPYTVTSVETGSGRKFYSAKFDATQLIKESTAYIMNKLLLEPLTDGGTAQRAAIDGIPVGGKTGTGTDFAGCWFVSFTPEYSFAFWHDGEIVRQNVTTDIFADMAAEISFDESVQYPDCDKVKELQYCEESGGLATGTCRNVATGYYASHVNLKACYLHQ